MAKSYEIKLSKNYLRDLKKFDVKSIERIVKEVEKLGRNPYIGRKIAGAKVGSLRLRIGDYRLRYDIYGNEVWLYRVRHRKDIYKKVSWSSEVRLRRTPAE